MFILDKGNESCRHQWEYHNHGNYQKCIECGRTEFYEMRTEI